MKDLDSICTQIYTDVDNIIRKFLLSKNTEQSRRILKAEITNYFQNALAQGITYQMPEIRLEYPGMMSEVVNVVLIDQETGEKIEAIDQIVTPLAKYSNTDDGGIIGF